MASKRMNVILVTDWGWIFGRGAVKWPMLSIIILGLLALLYFALVLRTAFLLTPRRYPHRKERFFSVIIAARNEGRRVLPLIASLQKLDYPAGQREIIFVDDASEDDTAALITKKITTLPGARLISVSPAERLLPGKKNALHRAIMEARGELIAVTDADCIVPPGWLRAFNDCFDERDIMLLGHSRVSGHRGFLNLYLRFDNLFSGIMVAVPALLGLPLSSVGRNMAYRRSAYVQSGGYPQLARHRSGDDVFLTELFRQKLTGHIRYCSCPGSLVSSEAPETLREIFWQQIRKNSKLPYKSLPALFLTLFLFVLHLLMAVMLFFPGTVVFAATILGLKLLLEFLALWRACDFFGEPGLKKALPLFQGLYPLLTVILGGLGMLGLYKWKP